MLTNAKPAQPFLLYLQAVGEATSHLAGHTTASPHGSVRIITFNGRPWSHWHPQQNKYMSFPIYITSPQIPVANLWMRISPRIFYFEPAAENL